MKEYDLSPGSWRLSLGVVLLGALLLAAAGPGGWPAGSSWTLAACVAVAIYGEWRATRIKGYGVLSLSEPLYFATVLVHGAGAGVTVAALGGSIAGFLGRKPAPVIAFNLGWSACTYAVADLIFGAFGRPEPFSPGGAVAAAVAALGSGLAAVTLQAFGESQFQSMPLRETFHELGPNFRYAVVSAFGLGLLGVELVRLGPAAVLLLALPIEVFSGYVAQTRLNRNLQRAMADLEAAQAALIASEKRAAAGLLAAGVAHEINNPLAAIVNATYALDDQGSGAVELIRKAAKRAAHITEQLLVYARPARDAGPCDLAEALEETLLLMGRPLKDDGVEVAGPARGVRVGMAQGPLMQILSNLLQNARQAILEKGGGGRVSVAAVPRSGGVEVTVADTGGGIAAEVRERVWDPFFTTREIGQGTGLGLALVRSLVEESGGTIELDSTGPGGTVFRLSLPGPEGRRP